MRRSLEDHRLQPWQVHDRAVGFDLLDVWRYPVRLSSTVPLARFLDFLSEMHDEMRAGGGAAAQLFRLRRTLGRLFGWDREVPARARAAGGAADTSAEDPDAHTFLGFDSVYESEDEVLFRLENETVEAMVHLGRVSLDPGVGSLGDWSPQMAVYVKRKGLLGRIYMAMISPFRHYVVYPAMMRAAERGWPRFAAREGLG